jgi:hypothetical protein
LNTPEIHADLSPEEQKSHLDELLKVGLTDRYPEEKSRKREVPEAYVSKIKEDTKKEV